MVTATFTNTALSGNERILYLYDVVQRRAETNWEYDMPKGVDFSQEWEKYLRFVQVRLIASEIAIHLQRSDYQALLSD